MSVCKSAGEPRFGLRDPDARGYFGAFGGRFVPETLMAPTTDVRDAYLTARADPAFRDQLRRLLTTYAGRPTPVFEARRLAAACGGARIVLKREDLTHTGAHKINNAIGQALVAVRMGKRRVVAETGAGQHGVASATACALLGLECDVYMGAEDNRSMSCACDCSARVSSAWRQGVERSRTPSTRRCATG
jgi:tryptophan synthase beta chain